MYIKKTPKVLVVATSSKTKGGITAVINAYKRTSLWNKFHCKWIATHRDGSKLRKASYMLIGFTKFIFLLPFYDIVHFHLSLERSIKRKYPFYKLAKILKKKIIIHLHCGSQIDEIWNNYYQELLFNADICILLSEDLKKKVFAHTKKESNLRVLYNPCPLITPNINYKKDSIILFAGTLCKEKGYLDLIEAFGKIASKHKKWKVYFAGNGDIETGMNLAQKLGILSQITFLGWTTGDDKDKIFKNSTLFCLPSYAEGFPMAVLDAWAYGLPVITTPVGGIPDVVINEKNGLLFSPGDINHLASNLERMITDEGLRIKITNESYKLAHSTLSIDTITNNLNNIYLSHDLYHSH